MSIQTAGMLLFVHTDALDTMEEMVRHVNADTRVSSEVLSIHLVKPTRDAVDELSRSLREQDHLKDMERMNRLKGNNALRDLTAGLYVEPFRVTFNEKREALTFADISMPGGLPFSVFMKKYSNVGTIDDSNSVLSRTNTSPSASA